MSIEYIIKIRCRCNAIKTIYLHNEVFNAFDEETDRLDTIPEHDTLHRNILHLFNIKTLKLPERTTFIHCDDCSTILAVVVPFENAHDIYIKCQTCQHTVRIQTEDRVLYKTNIRDIKRTQHLKLLAEYDFTLEHFEDSFECLLAHACVSQCSKCKSIVSFNTCSY